MIVKLLTEHHLEFLSLKEGCRGLSESTLVKMSNCWKSHETAQLLFPFKYGAGISESVYCMFKLNTFLLSVRLYKQFR